MITFPDTRITREKSRWKGARTDTQQVAAEEEDGHHGEAVVEIELVLRAAERVQDPAHEHKGRAALPQQEHRACRDIKETLVAQRETDDCSQAIPTDAQALFADKLQLKAATSPKRGAHTA